MAAGAEGRIQAAIRRVAGDDDMIMVSGDDDLAVALHGHRAGEIVAAEVGGDPAADSEARVEGPAGRVASQGDVVVAGQGAAGRSSHHDPAVRAQGQGGSVVIVAEIGHNLAVGPEREIEGAVGGVAGEGEVAAPRRRAAGAAGTAGDEDLAVGLEHEGGGRVVLAEIRGHQAAGAECGVERTVGVIAGEREVARGRSGDEDLAVGRRVVGNFVEA